MTVSRVLLAGLFLALGVAAHAQDEEKKTIVVAGPNGLPDEYKESRYVSEFVKRYYKPPRRRRPKKGQPAPPKPQPKGKVRLTIGRFFDSGHSASTNKMEPFVQQAVPLDEDGKPHGEELYLKVRHNGPVRSVTWKHGRKHGPERLYAKGKVRVEIPWQNGKMHGAKKVYGNNGKLVSEVTFVNGKQEGLAKSYGPKGNVVRVIPYKDGKKNGKAVDYYPGTKIVKREVVYEDDEINGTTREYFANGKLKRKMQIKGSLMHGVIEMYDEESGRLVRKAYFIEGDSVSEAEFKQKYKP